MSKKRLDQLLVEKGLTDTREKAQRLILAGKVLVDDTPGLKPGQKILESAALRIRGEDHPYVSRGGIKLAQALDRFQIDPKGKVALDVGASTGGFSHVLLMREIQKIFAIDVGHNQMDWKIRSDSRVVVKERINARYLKFEEIGQKVDLIVVDVSFISLDKILPALIQFATPNTDWVTLVKPQFEVGKENVGKGGIVTSETAKKEAIHRLTEFGRSLGLIQKQMIESPITGTDGNQEFLAYWKLDTNAKMEN